MGEGGLGRGCGGGLGCVGGGGGRCVGGGGMGDEGFGLGVGVGGLKFWESALFSG